VRQPLPALAALVAFWWRGAPQDFEHAAPSPLWRTWAREVLLPWVSWEHQVAHTRGARRQAKLRQAKEVRHTALYQHALTLRLPVRVLEAWHTGARQQVQAFQRPSSAVEGRNGALARLHHHQRGLPQQRSKVWTVLHNCDCRAADGTTPASRFFQRTFPALLETVLSQMKALPLPRQRKHA
jgi:hypothetical protein